MEILSVIIILAIVVGISIPAVLTTVNGSKEKALQTAASSVADWVDRQYQVIVTGLDTAGVATLDSNFTAFCGATAANCTGTNPYSTNSATGNVGANFIIAAGQKTSNVAEIQVKINPNTGRSCVKVIAATSGDFQYSGASAAADYKEGGAC